MSKFRESAEANLIHTKPECISTVDLYSRDLVEALNIEAEDCPGLRGLLKEIESNIDRLGLEGSRQRRTVKRIDSLLESDLLASAQKRIKELLQRKGELVKVYQPGEQQKLLAELEESRKHLRDQETRTYRFQEELNQLASKIKQQSKEITSEIARLTGTKIHISLTI
jgi:predicted  nucleic acid-binding Zn-ribbon protein